MHRVIAGYDELTKRAGSRERSNPVGIISTEFTISLDGFIAGPNNDISHIFGWYTNGDTDLSIAGAPPFKVSRASADFLQQT